MNNDLFKGKWNQVKGKLKEKWGKLTDNEITQINGKRDQLLGKLQEKYGWEKKYAEDELSKFEKSVDEKKSEVKHDSEYFRKEREKEKRNSSKRDEEEPPRRKAR